MLFQFRLGGELVIGDIVDLVEFEEVAGFSMDDEMQDVDVLFVDGQDAIEQFVCFWIQHKAVQPVGQG